MQASTENNCEARCLEAQFGMPMKREHTTHYYLTELGKDAIGGFAQRAIAVTAPFSAPPVPPTAEILDE